MASKVHPNNSRILFPSNIPAQTSTITTSSTSTTKMPFFSRKSSFSASTTTLTSVTSTSSDASTTTLLKQSGPEKDYFTAFGTLQNAYGFGGSAPIVPSAPKSSKPTKSKSVSDATPATAPTTSQGKNYEAAYGALSTMYGFGGAPVAPTPCRSSK